MEIKLLPDLFLEPEGLITLGDLRSSNESLRVHLKQGDLDGACGIYALMMAIITSQTLTRREVMSIWGHPLDKRTKLHKAMEEIDPLFSDGLDADQLVKIYSGIQSHFSNKKRLQNIQAQAVDEQGKSVKNIIDESLADDMPCILRLGWKGGGAHWVTVIGVQNFANAKENYLVLDPGARYDNTTIWNGILRCDSNQKGSLPYLYWGNGIERQNCSIAMGVEFYRDN